MSLSVEPGDAPRLPVEELRKVQRTGQASLSVTLPKAWSQSFNLRAGQELRFKDLGRGKLEVSVVGPAGDLPPPEKVLTIDVTDAPPNLVGRLLVGAFITGQDAMVLTSREPLTEAQRQKAHDTVRRAMGTAVVDETPNRLEIKVFVDPTKHQVPGLLHRLARMIQMQLGSCQKALAEEDVSFLADLQFVEDEIDKFYLLIVRQLLLASDDFHVAREVGVPSHHFQLGDRVVAKMLEVIGDLVQKAGEELEEGLQVGNLLSTGSKGDLVRMFSGFEDLLVRTMQAFDEVSPAAADAVLEQLHSTVYENATLSETVVRRSAEKLCAARLQRIVVHLSTALEMLRTINEVTVNRSVEPEVTAHATMVVRPEEPAP